MQKRKILFSAVSLVLIGSAVFAYAISVPEVVERNLDGLTGDVNRGGYVARLSGCIACHTNVKAGGKFMAGGPEIKTPFGTFYAPNITPHKTDGIGDWNIKDFAKALTTGLSPNGSHYFPVFIYTNYTLMSDQDIVDLWAAMKTVKPEAGKAPPHELSFPFNQRILLGFWKRMFFTPGSYKADPSKSASWNRGAYIVEGPAHCVTCHTPTNVLGARDYGHDLEGNKNGPNGEEVPSIHGEDLVKNGWTAKDIQSSLRNGIKPDGDAFGGTMGEVVRDNTRWLTDDDLKAISEYVLSHKN